MAATFSIQAAAERTGLTPHVIRAWERRYGAITPERSAGRQRHYTEAEIERLSLLHRAVRAGHGIGKIASLSREELMALSAARRPAPAPAHPGVEEEDPSAIFRAEVIASTARFDGAALEDALRRALLALGHQGFLRLTVAPLAHEIGELWRDGELTAAHGHFFTASVRDFLSELTRQHSPSHAAPRIIVGTPVGQLHELGAVMAAASAVNLGWHVIYLGPSLPAHEIAWAARRNKATAVALSIVYPEDDPQLDRELSDLARLLPPTTRILVGGRAAGAYLKTLDRIGALYADSIGEMGRLLDSVRMTGQLSAP